MIETPDMPSLADMLIQEGVNQRVSLNSFDYANLNVNDYLGQSDGTAGWAINAQSNFACRINRIQPACISNWATLGLDSPRFEFKPRETGETPVYYFNPSGGLANTPAVAAMMQTISPEAYQPDDNGNVQPLDAGIALSVKSTIAESQQAAQQARMLSAQMGAASIPIPQALPDDLLIEINDQTCADAFQEVFDILWTMADCDFYVRENILYTVIQGSQFLAYEWNEDEHRPNVWNPEWMMVHVDPSRTDIGRSAWAIMDFLMSADEMKARFPDLDPQIIDQHSSTTPNLVGLTGDIYPSMWRKNNYRRNMTILRTMWRRYQPVPMDAQEALDGGHIVMGQPDAPKLGVIGRMGGGIRKMLGMGGDDEVPEQATDGGADPLEDGESEAADATNQGADAPPTVLRHAKTKAIVGSITADGTPVGNTSHANWPKRYSLQQVQIVTTGTGGYEISNKECEFGGDKPMIPLCQNVNIPIPQTPHGQGEPTRMRSAQRLLDNLMTNLAASSASDAFSVQAILRSVMNDLGIKDASQAYVKPGQTLVVSDDVAKAAGGLDKCFMSHNPAPLPESLPKFASQVQGMLDREGNMTDAPNMEGSPWSGQALEQAAAPNKSAVTMKGMRIEQMLVYLARLMDGDITSPVRMPAQLLHQMCPKYPIQVWEAFQTRRKRLTVDITCEITSGSGQMKDKKQANILNQYGNGSGVMGQFPAQCLEDLGYDTDSLIKKQNAFDQMRSASQQQSQPASAAVAQPGKPQGSQTAQAPQEQVTAAPAQSQQAA